MESLGVKIYIILLTSLIINVVLIVFLDKKRFFFFLEHNPLFSSFKKRNYLEQAMNWTLQLLVYFWNSRKYLTLFFLLLAILYYERYCYLGTEQIEADIERDTNLILDKLDGINKKIALLEEWAQKTYAATEKTLAVTYTLEDQQAEMLRQQTNYDQKIIQMQVNEKDMRDKIDAMHATLNSMNDNIIELNNNLANQKKFALPAIDSKIGDLVSLIKQKVSSEDNNQVGHSIAVLTKLVDVYTSKQSSLILKQASFDYQDLKDLIPNLKDYYHTDLEINHDEKVFYTDVLKSVLKVLKKLKLATEKDHNSILQQELVQNN